MSEKTVASEDGALRPYGREASPDTSPVSGFLLRRARQDVERIRAAAVADADATLTRARAEADALVAEARADGAAEGAALAAADLTQARRQTRRIVLSARREACERLREQVRAAVSVLLREDPLLVDRLRMVARGLAGPGVEIIEHPDGGFVARGEATRVDCSSPALADRAVEALGAEVERLWVP